MDEEALYGALKNNHLFTAALDCFTKEPYTGKLTQLDDIVLSSHMVSFTVEKKRGNGKTSD